MLQRIAIEGIQFPRLYIAENNEDVQLARANGVPYIRWRHGQEQLIRQLLRPTLEKMFPGIAWNKVLGKKKPVRSDVVIVSGRESDVDAGVAEYDCANMLTAQYAYDHLVDELDHDSSEANEDGEFVRTVDVAEDRRDCISDNSDLGYLGFTEDHLKIEDYIGDLSSYVDIDALQKLGLLPKFVGDVTDCIKHNLSQSMRWTEGYTKKLDMVLGKFRSKPELPNLLIIDISWSIPDGIAATMITLADTLRSQCNADLIITSRRSGYYPAGAELPKPQTLRDYYGRSNESAEFCAILDKYIAGREWGHVISFGDYDNPGNIWERNVNMTGTKVHAVHHYHTNKYLGRDHWTGYARWVNECCPDAEMFFDTDWCKVIDPRYKMN